MSNQQNDDHLSAAGFGPSSVAARRGETTDARIRQALREVAESLGITEAEIERHIVDYLTAARRSVAMDAMVRSHGLRSKRVLEVGSGLGNSLVYLRSQGIDVTGIEPGADWLDIVRQRLLEAGLGPERAVEGAGEALPFPDSSFDFAFSLQVLEHVSDPEQVVAEIARVLRPGGEVLITAPNYLSFAENHYRIAWFPGMPAWMGVLYLKLRRRDPEFYRKHVNNLTYPQVLRVCRKARLENVILTRYLKNWSRPSPGKYSATKRLILSLVSRLGTRPLELAYHMRLLFKDEITYIYRKPTY